MKTSLVIASVLLAGVAFKVAAYRIDTQNLREGDYTWSRNQQGDNYGGRPYNYNQYTPGQNIDGLQSGYQYKKQNMNNDNYESSYYDRSQQYDPYYYESDFGSSGDLGVKHQYKSQNQVNVDQSAGLTKKMVEKINTLQKIVLNHDIAKTVNDFDSEFYINKNIIKLSSQQDFVTFFNSTMKNLDQGHLEYMYINPEKDTVFAQYKFDKVVTVGSFKSNVRNIKSGYYTIVLNNVYSNVSTGFYNIQHSVIRPAKFEYADAIIKTDDGTETHAFNDALENRYLRVLQHVVSSEVLNSTFGGMIGQMKYEIRKPMEFHGAEKKYKLFDMRWKEDNVVMEMSNIGFQNPTQVEQPLNSVSYYRKSENTYRMRYDFELNDLSWTSGLTVESAGKRMNTRLSNFKIDKVDIQVTITKNLNQPKACGEVNTNVDVKGLQYNLNENVDSELMYKVEQYLQRFIEHSLESYFEEFLGQELNCYSSKY